MRRKASDATKAQIDLLDVTDRLRTGPCVPALREAVKAWRSSGYKGITDTTRILFNHWFYTDHKLPTGRSFKYHTSQKEAIETLVYVWEVDKVRSRKALLERYAHDLRNVYLPPHDDFARYCTKMATGTGKTKVISLAIAWQLLNAMRELEPIAQEYAKTFLLVAPNVIVYERLRMDFAGGRLFSTDPIIPKELSVFWDLECIMRGQAEGAYYEGALFLTNVQQLYDRREVTNGDEPQEMLDVLGPKPPARFSSPPDFNQRIQERGGNLFVINDEAHHTHDEENEWNNVIRRLHGITPIVAQLDVSATPRFQKGAIFPWTISDYPLKQAIIDGVVKRPVKGIAHIVEPKSDIASVRYQAYLAAGVERWREYREQLRPLGKKPVIFIMLNSTDDAEDVGDWLRTKYPSEFGGERTQVIHTDRSGEISKKDLDRARKAVREIDSDTSPINAIVSVLMLREGWDVQNVTVVVGLRPYTAKANILPEQTVGRGLRLMFRDVPGGYAEHVDVIGNNAFLQFVDELEKLEDLKFPTFDIGKDKVNIVSIIPLPDRTDYDLSMPILTPSLVRKKSLAEEIAAIDVNSFNVQPFPMSDAELKTGKFTYEGYDVITLQKQFEREYTVPNPQTAQEVIGYYARRIAEAVKLPAQFSVLAPKVKEFFEYKAFGRAIDLNDPAIVRAMSSVVAHYVCVDVFKKALQPLTIAEQVPELLDAGRRLSTCRPFPWSRPVWEGRKCIFNLVPCDNEFERTFAKFLDNANDVSAFSKLPRAFGFTIEYTDTAMNLRMYEPDFVVRDTGAKFWLLETKGQEDIDVARKDAAAIRWCANASELTHTPWRYLKVPQKEFEALQPSNLQELSVLYVEPLL